MQPPMCRLVKMAGGRPYSPDEIAVLKPFVAELCPWDQVLPRLNGRSYAAATRRLSDLRREAGTLWRVAPDASLSNRDERGRFAR